jgi:hypothetical protein
MFVGWAADHGPILVGVPDRVARLLPVSWEALLFLLQNGGIRLQRGGIVPGKRPIRSSAASPAATNDTLEARRSARLLGRWFANQGQPASILQMFGSDAMTLQLRAIAIYSHEGERREVTFRLGKLNIVTGAPKTGKSALLDIVDYCWGHASRPFGISRAFGRILGISRRHTAAQRIFVAFMVTQDQGTTKRSLQALIAVLRAVG